MNLDNENVKTLLHNIQKPGGVGQGETLSFKTEMNLHITVYFIGHKNRTSLSVEYSEINVPNIHALKKQQDMELDMEKF